MSFKFPWIQIPYRISTKMKAMPTFFSNSSGLSPILSPLPQKHGGVAQVPEGAPLLLHAHGPHSRSLRPAPGPVLGRRSRFATFSWRSMNRRNRSCISEVLQSSLGTSSSHSSRSRWPWIGRATSIWASLSRLNWTSAEALCLRGVVHTRKSRALIVRTQFNWWGSYWKP